MNFKVLQKLVCLFMALFVAFSCNRNTSDKAIQEDPIFSSFSNYDIHSAHFRVGAQMDTLLYHFQIKAMTSGYFDDHTYMPQSIYILKHETNDSIVINTYDAPLIPDDVFMEFYDRHKNEMQADTVIDSQIFDKFFMIEHKDVVNVESFQDLPFLFLDVNFNGYPALLVRQDRGGGFYYYTVYGITPNGFHEVDFEPYLSIKSRTNSWCFGGSTEFDFINKTIKVFGLSKGSCSDYGTQITDIYKLNTFTEKFDKKQIKSEYDFNY